MSVWRLDFLSDLDKQRQADERRNSIFLRRHDQIKFNKKSASITCRHILKVPHINTRHRPVRGHVTSLYDSDDLVLPVFVHAANDRMIAAEIPIAIPTYVPMIVNVSTCGTE